MRLWLIMLLSHLIAPITMLVTGILYLKRPVKKINWMYGYRTRRAMENQETWDFAQKYFGNLCWRLGIGLTVFILLFMASALGRSEETLGTMGFLGGTVEVFTMVYALTPTERALKEKFSTQKENNGAKKEKNLYKKVVWRWKEKERQSDFYRIMERI